MTDQQKDVLERTNPKRRDFLKKMIKVSFAIPAVVSVSMLDQKLNLAVAGVSYPNAVVTS